MIAATEPTLFHPTHHVGKAAALALRLTDAENALHTLTSGQVDAIVDPTGRTYLLRPAQENLRQSERRLQAVFDGVADVIAVVNRAGVILIENRSAHRVLGYAPVELVGSVIFKLVHHSDVPALYCAFVAVMEGFDGRAIVRFHHLTRDGSYLLVEATLGKLQEIPVEAVILTIRPTTGYPGRVEFPGHARQFTAIHSDEPASAAQSKPERKRGKSALQAHLLKDWDDSTTAGQYQVRLQLASINAQGDVRLILDIDQSRRAETRIEVCIDLSASGDVAPADPLGLQREMWSLVKNTVEAFNRDSELPGVDHNAADSGCTPALPKAGNNVEPELLPLVFGSLRQGTDAMEQLYGGLRFGLFIAKGIADAQRSTLTVSNDTGGQTAPFRLNFKITPAATAQLI